MLTLTASRKLSAIKLLRLKACWDFLAFSNHCGLLGLEYNRTCERCYSRLQLFQGNLEMFALMERFHRLFPALEMRVNCCRFAGFGHKLVSSFRFLAELRRFSRSPYSSPTVGAKPYKSRKLVDVEI